MLSYIIPPIIIIIGTATLIIFLFRKVQEIPEQSMVLIENEQRKKRSSIIPAISQFWLKILERIMQRLKLMSLKFHNVTNNLFHYIHEKRQKRANFQREEVPEKVLEEIDEKKKIVEVQIAQKNISRREKKNQHFVRNSIPSSSQPAKGVKKDKLEEVLIKRIAINPKDVEAYERLGDYYMECDNRQDSIECFRQVLKLSTINYKARIKLRRLEKMVK
jgi:hypothetical protein